MLRTRQLSYYVPLRIHPCSWDEVTLQNFLRSTAYNVSGINSLSDIQKLWLIRGADQRFWCHQGVTLLEKIKPWGQSWVRESILLKSYCHNGNLPVRASQKFWKLAQMFYHGHHDAFGIWRAGYCYSQGGLQVVHMYIFKDTTPYRECSRHKHTPDCSIPVSPQACCNIQSIVTFGRCHSIGGITVDGFGRFGSCRLIAISRRHRPNGIFGVCGIHRGM